MEKHVGVAAVGDVLDINCWSSTPFYFYSAGRSLGLFDQPWSLAPERLRLLRLGWNLRQLMLGRGKGGFQYSPAFLSLAEAQIPSSLFSSTVISFNQVFPRAATIARSNGKIFYYIDATLTDLFKEPAYGIRIPVSMQKIAIAQERANYLAAKAVVSMGTWVYRSLKDDYGVPDSRIRHVLPGANFDLPAEFQFRNVTSRPGIDRPLVLGFVGKDWKRKGLGFLLDVRDYLAAGGYNAKVRALGNCPDALKARPGLEYTGFIDKQTNTSKFIEEISSCDIGCLFSTSEALGISTLEFLRVGVPVAGFYHQGLIDTLLSGASLRFNYGQSVEEVGSGFIKFMENDDHRKALQERARRASEQVTWKRAALQWKLLLDE